MTAWRSPHSVDETLTLLSGGDYVADRNLATSLFVAFRLNRPLFLEGEAGVGKTALAGVLAERLGRSLLRLQCYEGLDVSSAVYEWNYARQMIEIRLSEAMGDRDRQTLAGDIFSERFLIGRPLLEALRPHESGPPVLLIDELDRADEPFEAFLLEVLADYQITIPEIGTIRADGATDRDDHVEPHPRDPRCAQAALPLSLDRLPGRSARARDPARPRARRRPAADLRGRGLRAAAPRARFLQVAGRGGEHRLAARALDARRRRASTRPSSIRPSAFS